MLYERIYKEHQRLEQEINTIQTKLDTYPDGTLICCHHGNRCKWYQSDGHTKTYIPKANRAFAEQLAMKKYLSCHLADLSQEKKALESYLKKHHPEQEQSHLTLSKIPAYAELLSSQFKPLSQDLYEWMESPYEQNPHHPEHLIHRTNSGHLVRSKSEAMIDLFLYTNHIPFRYECALHLNSATLYPDFTIRHPYTGELYYWEHFGMMDDPSYRKNTSSKLQLYIMHGIIPSIQLITTYETQDHPLSTEVIQNIIQYYFSLPT